MLMPERIQHAPYALAVERALAILEALDESRRGLTLSELSRKLAIPKSTTHVLLQTLQRLQYAERDEGGRRYRIGLRTRTLGHGMARGFTLAEMALAPMQRLAEELRLTSHLAVLDGLQGVYVQKVEPPGLIRFGTHIGKRMDLHCTAVGKVLIAFACPEAQERFLAKGAFLRHTPRTIATADAMRQEIARVRRLGYGVDNEEEEGEVRCFAVPVFYAGLRTPAAMSVTGTTGQLPMSRGGEVLAHLRRAAREVEEAKPASLGRSERL